MTIVSIDPQRRMYLPEELGIKSDKAIIIRRGNSFLLIPVPQDIIPIDTGESTKELRLHAETKAQKEATNANRV